MKKVQIHCYTIRKRYTKETVCVHARNYEEACKKSGLRRAQCVYVDCIYNCYEDVVKA